MIEPSEQTVDDRPVWSSWREVPAVVLHPAHLRKTIGVAFFVGTVLFTINQLDVVIAGGIKPARCRQDQPHLSRAFLRFKLRPPRWAPRQ